MDSNSTVVIITIVLSFFFFFFFFVFPVTIFGVYYLVSGKPIMSFCPPMLLPYLPLYGAPVTTPAPIAPITPITPIVPLSTAPKEYVAPKVDLDLPKECVSDNKTDCLPKNIGFQQQIDDLRLTKQNVREPNQQSVNEKLHNCQKQIDILREAKADVPKPLGPNELTVDQKFENCQRQIDLLLETKSLGPDELTVDQKIKQLRDHIDEVLKTKEDIKQPVVTNEPSLKERVAGLEVDVATLKDMIDTIASIPSLGPEVAALKEMVGAITSDSLSKESKEDVVPTQVEEVNVDTPVPAQVKEEEEKK
jgi:hypothetical protein